MSADKPKTVTEQAEAQAQSQVALRRRIKEIEDAQRVNRMTPHEFEEWSAAQIAKREADLQKERLQALREERELGARLRGHGV